jgi:hypothetical protein
MVVRFVLSTIVALAIASLTTLPILLYLFRQELADLNGSTNLLATSQALAMLVESNSTAKQIAIALFVLIGLVELAPVLITVVAGRDQRSSTISLESALAEASRAADRTRSELASNNLQFLTDSGEYRMGFNAAFGALTKSRQEP